METRRCPKCNAAPVGDLTHDWECGTSETLIADAVLESGEVVQGEHCRDRCAIALKDAEIKRLKAEAENWRRMYRELYCEIWCATEYEFDEEATTDGLAHTDTMKEIGKMLCLQIKPKEAT